LLQKIEQVVDWHKLDVICRPMFKDSRRCRPSIPIQFSLKCLILQYLYNLSDPALEDALIDRMSFQRFLKIGFDTDIPDFSTLWRFRERLSKAGLLDQVFTIQGMGVSASLLTPVKDLSILSSFYNGTLLPLANDP